MSIEAMKAVKMIYANTTKHDWPEDVWDAICQAIEAEKREWVGLTDEEVEAYEDWADFQVGCGRQTLFDMVRDIEAKLQERNT